VHVDKIFFPDYRFYHKAQVVGNRVSITLAYDLAGILNGEFNFQVFVPIGIDLESAFPDPSGIVLIDALDFKVVSNVEFFQSGPD
jgi:hypothetical protein